VFRAGLSCSLLPARAAGGESCDASHVRYVPGARWTARAVLFDPALIELWQHHLHLSVAAVEETTPSGTLQFHSTHNRSSPHNLFPHRQLMSNSDFWTTACLAAVYERPLQQKLDLLFSFCSITVIQICFARPC
jgi:hypothetical protein